MATPKKKAGVPQAQGVPVEAGAASFRITCRNKVSGTIGGVEFVDGVGYTSNGFSASWFANKDGYSVDSGKEQAET